MYRLAGLSISNKDGSHNPTAYINIPANGQDNIELRSLYGGTTIGTGPNNAITSIWTFGSDGKLTLPSNTGGDSVIFSNTGNVQLYSLHPDSRVKIRVKGDGGDSQWEFDSGGNLATPSGLTIGTGGVPGTSLVQDGGLVELISAGEGATAVGWVDVKDNPGNIAVMYLGSNQVQITTGSTPYVWNFQDGNLVLPTVVGDIIRDGVKIGRAHV